MRKVSFLLFLFISVSTAVAQQIPLGSCGVVHIHNAAGNRTKRLYYCNNGGTYPTKPARGTLTPKELETAVFQEVIALYPDPTTGIFQITFSKALTNTGITVTDVSGKTVQKFKASGVKLTCNISNQPAGEYFVIIEQPGMRITKKVIKQ